MDRYELGHLPETRHLIYAGDMKRAPLGGWQCALVLLLVAAAAACGSTDSGSVVGIGQDAAVDAGAPEAGADVSPDGLGEDGAGGDAAPDDAGPIDAQNDEPASDGPGPEASTCPAVGTSLGACDQCLDSVCEAQLCDCDAECVAIEACLEAVCGPNVADSEEGACQVYCQNEHPASKQKHLAVVSCAYGAQCVDCQAWPAAYDACRGAQIAGPCAPQRAACDASSDCLAYESCIAGCASAATCVACSDSASGAAGRQLREALEGCVARECLAEWWAR